MSEQDNDATPGDTIPGRTAGIIELTGHGRMTTIDSDNTVATPAELLTWTYSTTPYIGVLNDTTEDNMHQDTLRSQPRDAPQQYSSHKRTWTDSHVVTIDEGIAEDDDGDHTNIDPSEGHTANTTTKKSRTTLRNTARANQRRRRRQGVSPTTAEPRS